MDKHARTHQCRVFACYSTVLALKSDPVIRAPNLQGVRPVSACCSSVTGGGGGADKVPAKPGQELVP